VFRFLLWLLLLFMKKLLKFFLLIREKSGLFRRQNRSPSKTSIGQAGSGGKRPHRGADFQALWGVSSLHPAKHHTGESVFTLL